MSFILQDSAGSIDVIVPANGLISVATRGKVTITRLNTATNERVVIGQVGEPNNNYFQVFGSFSATLPTTIGLDNLGKLDVIYDIGTAPRSLINRLPTVFGFSPGQLNATGTLTFELLATGLVTSTTAAAVTATLDTGATMEAKSSFLVGEGFDWSVINTGGTNAFTVTASSGHTITGSGTVAANGNAIFRTVKTALNTFVSYRMS